MAMKINRREFLKATAVTGSAIVAGGTFFLPSPHFTFVGEAGASGLPKPNVDGGKALMQLLKERKSLRQYRPDKMPPQVISNLLWAAFGINRPDGKRTAPTARNRQDIDIYICMAEGTYLYDAKAHALKLVAEEDLRALTGTQPYVKEAPVNLVYVADLSKMGNVSEDERSLFAGAHTGFISQNVYLFCASEGLSTVVRALIDRPALAKAIKLRSDQKIVLAQCVGYPKG